MRSNLIRSAAILLPLLSASAALAQSTAAPVAATTPAAPAAMAAPTPAAPAATAANLSKVDKDFITKAAEGGTAEVQMAQLAQQKSQSASVKQFAQGMIDDHTPNNQKLVDLATSKGVTPPADPSASQKKMLAKLQGLDGAKFDHAYMAGQVKSHQTMLKLFEHEATNGKDTDLKAFAESTQPTIQKHLTMAQNTKS